MMYIPAKPPRPAAAVFSLPHVPSNDVWLPDDNAVEVRGQMRRRASIPQIHSVQRAARRRCGASPPAAFCATHGTMIMGAASSAPGIAGGKA
jgi:hypothetical protein